jgi:hypothetical protein
LTAKKQIKRGLNQEEAIKKKKQKENKEGKKLEEKKR